LKSNCVLICDASNWARVSNEQEAWVDLVHFPVGAQPANIVRFDLEQAGRGRVTHRFHRGRQEAGE
jgi:hypothetical protein